MSQLLAIVAGIALLGVAVLSGVMYASDRMATRGVRLDDPACAWVAGDAYLSTVRVRNLEPVPKAVSVHVQGRFRPPKGGRWPSRDVRFRYAAISQDAVVIVPAEGEAQARATFQIPGVSGFPCKAKATIGRQQRLPAQERAGESLPDTQEHAG